MIEVYPQEAEDRLAFWQDVIKRAEAYYEPYFAVSRRMSRIYENQATSWREKIAEEEGLSEEGRMKANLIFGYVDQTRANMLDRSPVFSVTPESPVSVDGVPVVKAVVNHWYTRTDQFRQDDRCLQDALLTLWGVKKIGWNTKFEEEEETTETLSDIIIDSPIDENMFFLEATPTRVGEDHDHESHIETHMTLIEDPTIPNELKEAIIWPHIRKHEKLRQIGLSPEGNSAIKFDAPFGKRWKYDEFLIDPDATDGLSDARWIAFKVKKPLYDVYAKFGEEAAEGLTANSNKDDMRLSRWERDYSAGTYEAHDMVEYWEIWARDFPITPTKKVNKLICIAMGHDKILQEEDEWPFENIEDYPCEILSMQSGTETWFNYPSLTLGGGDNIQKLTNEILDAMLQVIRKQKNLIAYDPEYISEREMQNALRLPDMSAIRVERLAESQGKAFQPIEFGKIQGDQNFFLNNAHNLFDRANGTPTPQNNRTMETATEVSAYEKRNTAREDRRMNLFKDFQVRTAEKFWRLHSEFKPQKQFLIDPRIGEWVAVEDHVVKGEYRFRMDISSKKVSEAVERQDLQNIFNLLVGVTPTFIQLGMPIPNLQEVLRLVLERGFNIQDVERYLQGSMSSEVQESLATPEGRQALLENLKAFRGGGDSVAGQGPGPIDPQAFARNPSTAARQTAEAERLEG